MYINLHFRYSVPAPPGVRVHTGPEDQGPGPLRLCTQICTAGTLYPHPLGAEFIRDLRIKALDLSVFVRKSALQVHCISTLPGVGVHTGPEDQGPGPLRLCAQICTSGTVYPLSLGAEFIRDLSFCANLQQKNCPGLVPAAHIGKVFS